MDTSELRRRLAARYADTGDVSLVYLFGSQATGAAGPASDYDFGILVDRGNDERQVTASFSHMVSQVLEAANIDVVVLNDAPVELAYAVIAQGQLLYERDVSTRVEYEARVLSLYGDYLPVLREQRQNIIAGGDYESRVQRYRAALGRTRRTLGQTPHAPERTP